MAVIMLAVVLFHRSGIRSVLLLEDFQAYKLTLKAPRKIIEQTTIYFYFLFFSERIMLDIRCESSAKQTIQM